jgi:hypothetical protein
MVNAQEYQQIINQPFMPENIWDDGNFYPQGEIVNSGNEYYLSKQPVPPGTPITDTDYWQPIENPTTVGDWASTRNKDLEINDALVIQANAVVPYSGYDNTKFYILPTVGNQPAFTGLTVDDTQPTVDGTEGGQGTTPTDFGYTMGYLTGDEYAPNGLPVTPGVQFPPLPSSGDYALRLDYYPNRLFRYDGRMWIHISDNVRSPLDWGPENLSQRSSFVNNTHTVSTTDQGNIPSRQSLSQALGPNAENGNDGGNKPAKPYPNTQPGQKSS